MILNMFQFRNACSFQTFKQQKMFEFGKQTGHFLAKHLWTLFLLNIPFQLFLAVLTPSPLLKGIEHGSVGLCSLSHKRISEIRH